MHRAPRLCTAEDCDVNDRLIATGCPCASSEHETASRTSPFDVVNTSAVLLQPYVVVYQIRQQIYPDCAKSSPVRGAEVKDYEPIRRERTLSYAV
jgi:hypothetical protein